MIRKESARMKVNGVKTGIKSFPTKNIDTKRKHSLDQLPSAGECPQSLLSRICAFVFEEEEGEGGVNKQHALDS
jgi:hypothetical protein